MFFFQLEKVKLHQKKSFYSLREQLYEQSTNLGEETRNSVGGHGFHQPYIGSKKASFIDKIIRGFNKFTTNLERQDGGNLALGGLGVFVSLLALGNLINIYALISVYP